MKYRIILQQYGIELSIPTKLTMESEVSILWYRYRPSLLSSLHNPSASPQELCCFGCQNLEETCSRLGMGQYRYQIFDTIDTCLRSDGIDTCVRRTAHAQSLRFHTVKRKSVMPSGGDSGGS